MVNILHKELDHFAELFNADQAECSVSLIHAGGATSDLPRASTAYRWRAAVYQAYIMITFEDKWLEREMRAFLARFKAQLRVHSISRHAAFINFPDDDIPKDAYERAYYGWNAERLREVKAEWDPTDFFKWSQSIQLPAAELRMRPQMAPADGTLGEPVDDDEGDYVSDFWAMVEGEDRTDRSAAERWDQGFEVSRTEWLNGATDMYPPVEPGTKSTDIENIYDADDI